MTNEIVKSQNVIQSMDDVERAAKAMSASGFFPDSKEFAKAIVKVLAGRELGFGAFASMTGVAVIQGKPVIGANLLAAAVKQTGRYNYRVTEHTAEICTIAFYEGKISADTCVGTSTFTMKDAQAAGLAGKDNWKKYPRNMLFARAIANGQKWYAPDVFNGVTVYTPDELGASVDEDGNFIEAKAEPVMEFSDRRAELVKRYNALSDKASAAGLNSIPVLSAEMTDEEITATGVKLAERIKEGK